MELEEELRVVGNNLKSLEVGGQDYILGVQGLNTSISLEPQSTPSFCGFKFNSFVYQSVPKAIS